MGRLGDKLVAAGLEGPLYTNKIYPAPYIQNMGQVWCTVDNSKGISIMKMNYIILILHS